MRLRSLLVLLTLVAVVVPAATAQAQATRTWVSGVGDDANPCSRTAPCKTFAGAISKTAEGGEINAIDSGPYGVVTITKALTIDTRSVHGGVLSTLTPGINVNAGADDDVVLRGLDVNGGPLAGGACAPYGGTNGISVIGARSVRIEDSNIERMATSAIRVIPTTGDPDVLVNRVDISSTCGPGIDVAPGAGRSADVTVLDSTVFNTGTGVRAADRAHVWLDGTSIFGNDIGLQTAGSGVIDSWWGTNHLAGNTVDGAPTNVLGAPPAPGPTVVRETVVERVEVPAPATPTAPGALAPPTVAPAIPRCIAPSLTGLTVAKARTRLAAAGCRLGRVTRRATRNRKRVGRITAQKRTGRTVAVTVGTRAAR